MPGATSILVVADTNGPAFHVGDEAMLIANLERLRSAGLDPRVAGRGAGVEALDGVTALLCSGGGNLRSAFPDLLGQRIALFAAAHERGLPVVLTGQTLGPDLEPVDRDRLGAALREAALVGVRELQSAALAADLGVPTDRIVLQVDDAFRLAPAPPPDAALQAATEQPYVAVTLDASFAEPAARPALRRIAGQLADFGLAEELAVLFVPHEGTLGSDAELDGVAGRALGEELTERGVRFMLAPVLEPAAVVSLTERARLVVSSRYHPLVFAVAAAVPAIGIHRDRYTRIKLEGALGHAGLEHHALSLAAAERGELAGRLRDVWAATGDLRATMTAQRPALAEEDDRRWGHVLAALGHGDTRRNGWPATPLARAALAALPPTPAAAPRTGAAGIGEDAWEAFSHDGFMRLGPLLTPAEVEALCRRADEYALGERSGDGIQLQLDTGGAYDELPEAVDAFEEGTHLYRKIQGLETDDLFRGLVEHPICLEVCARMYGRHAPISIFRAMIMNKPARQGTVLPWHQDGGDVWKLDRDPLVTIWVALDPATTANGCMEVVPGTHRLGLVTDEGSTLSEADAERHCPPERRRPLEVEAGHGVLLHNWLIHRSGVNPSPRSRRAFTACYLDGRTRGTLTGAHYPLIAGSRPPAEHHFIEEMQRDRIALRESAETSGAYARSLEEHAAALEAQAGDATAYARGLEAEVDRLRGALEAAPPAPRAAATRIIRSLGRARRGGQG